MGERMLLLYTAALSLIRRKHGQQRLMHFSYISISVVSATLPTG